MDFLDELERRKRLAAGASVSGAVATPADKAALARKYASELGLSPEAVLADFPAVEQEARTQQITGALATAPAAQRFYSDPSRAAVAHDDVEKLTAFESLLVGPRALVSAAPYMASGYYNAQAAVVGALGLDNTPSRKAAKKFEDIGKATAGRTDGWVSETIQGAGRSAGMMAPGVVASVLTEGALAPLLLGAGVPAVSAGGDSAGRAMDAGKSPATALRYGATDAALEFAFDATPLGKMFKAAKAGAPLGELLAKSLGREIPTEVATTLSQNFNEWITLHPEKSALQFLSEQPQAIIDTIAQTALATGGVTAAAVAGNRLAGRQRRAQEQAQTAQADAGLTDRLERVAAASALRERDPASFQEFVAEAAAEHGAPEDVYVTPEAFNQAFSTPEGQQLLQSMPQAVQDAATQAGSTGGDVRIPLAEFVTHVADTPTYEALKDHLKLDPSGMTRFEAEEFVKTEGDQLRADVEAEMAKVQADDEFTASRQRVIETIKEQLDTTSRFTTDVNDLYASFAGHGVAVQAARMGMTPEAFLAAHPINVDAGDGQVIGADTLQQNAPMTAPPVDAAGNIQLTHWGKKAGLKSLNPKKWGSNPDILSRTERQMAGDDRLSGRVHFGIGVGQPGGYTPEHGVGKHLYTSEIAAKDLYDYDADPLGLRAGRVKELLAEEGFDEQPETGQPDYGYADEAAVAYDLAIKEAGYKGFWTGEQGSGLVGVMFERPKVDYKGEDDGSYGQPNGDRGGRAAGRETAPLAGAPNVQGATGPDAKLVAVAEQFAADNGIDLKRQAEYATVDPERAARIAEAYEAMPHAPEDPKVREAYANLIAQTRAQYDALAAAGYEFTFFDGATDPYEGNPWNAMRDLRANQRMAVYGTYDGYGTEGVTQGAADGNPMLADTGLEWPDQNGEMHPVLANDLFRAVHDAFGHGLEGAGFRAQGEENAWQAHVRMFTGSAVGAITSETRGQNSWLNYGPYGEANRNAKVEDTVFADQKTGLMPEWTWSEGRVADAPEQGSYAQSGVPLFDQPLTIDGKVTVKAIGEAFHADHMKREGRQLFPENDEADYAIVLQGMKDELGAQLKQPNSGVGWYSKDVSDALELASKAFPTLATDQTHRQLYLTLAGLFSNGMDPDLAFMSSAEAFEAYLATGTIPVSRADAARESGREPKRTSFKDKTGKQVDKDAGWGPRNSANEQQLGFVKFIVEREGSLEAGLHWLMAEQPREAINSAMTAESGLYKAGRYTTKAEISGPPALGVMVFGEKLGRYTMGLHGVDVDAGDVTIDLWYIRAYRRLAGRLFETPIGAEGVVGGPTDKDRQVIIKLTGELSKEFDLPTGDVQAVLWFFEKRLWGAQGLRTNEGTNSSGARKLLRSRGIDDGAGGDAARDGAGTAAAQQGALDGAYAQGVAPVFYSALSRAVEASPTKSAPAAQWLATLSKTPGVKQEEIEWTGVREWLGLQEGNVTKQALGEYLAGHGVQVEEKVLGDVDPNYQEDNDWAVVQDGSRFSIFRGGDEVERGWATEELAQEALARHMANIGRTPTEFDSYKLPGADDTYKELLLTLPQIDGPSTHWSADNVVAHARVTERQSAAGKRVLFLEEVQSDWHQKGRDQGYNGDSSAEEKAAAELALQRASTEKGEASDGYINAVREALYAKADFWDTQGQVGRGLATEIRERTGAGLSVSAARQYLAKYNIDLTPEVQAAEARHTTARLRLDEAYQAEAATAGGIPDAPFRKSWSTLVMKRMIRYAVDNGFEQVAWINGNQQNGGTTGGDGSFFYERNLVNVTNDLLKKYGAKVDKVDLRDPKAVAAFDASRAAGLRTRQELLDAERAANDAEGVALAQKRIDDYNAKTEELFNQAAPPTALGIQNGFTITPELAEAAAGGMPLFQENRGTFTPATNTISLLRTANLSTFLHELGHWHLETLSRMAVDPAAPQEIRDDFGALLGWFGITGDGQLPPGDTWNAMPLEEKRPYHEQFARGFEAYLFEGKAPTPELRGLFQRFSAWLKSVYRDLANLNVELTDEVRGVMNRMLATPAQIAEAEHHVGFAALFPGKPVVMSDDEWATYQRLGVDASLRATDELQARWLRDMKWLEGAKSRELKRLQAEAKDKRSAIKDEITAEVMSEPVNQVREFLTAPPLDSEGAPTDSGKLSRPDLKERYVDNPDVDISKLGRMAAPVGIDSDELAERFGYGSGDEMIRDLLTAEKADEKIEGITDQRMLERYGDISDERAASAAALEAVHNGLRARILQAEYNALAKATGQKKILNDAARSLAKELVGRVVLKDLKAERYVAAERKAGRAAEVALKDGDLVAAAAHKRTQIINFYAARAVREAKDGTQKGMTLFKRIVSASNEGVSRSRDRRLVDATRAILAAYGLDRKRNNVAEAIELLKRYSPDLYTQVEPTIMSAALAAQSIELITVDEFTALHDTVKQLWTLSRRSKQMVIDGRKEETDAIRTELVNRLATQPPSKSPSGVSQAPTAGDRFLRGLDGMRASLRRVEHWVQLIDGGNAGPFRKYIWNPISGAADDYRVAKSEVLRQLVDVLQNAPGMKRGKIAAPELGYTFGSDNGGVGKAALLHAILHTGNDSNKAKLLLGRQWATENSDGSLDTSRWDQFVDRMHREGVLTKADYDFAQQVWDLLETTKPGAQASHFEMYGRYFSEVTANSFETPFGEYAGGYVPALTDGWLVPEKGLQTEEDLLRNGDAAMFPTPARGFTKSRDENYTKALELDLGVLPRHLDQVLKFTHLAVPTRDALRLLRAPALSEALHAIDPTAMTDMLMPWLNRAAKQITETPTKGQGGKAVDAFFRELRKRTGVGLMIGNVSNAMQQFTGAFVTAVKVKPRYLLPALWQFTTDPGGTSAAAAGASKFMSSRTTHASFEAQAQIEAMLLDPTKYDKLSDWADRHAYFLQGQTQNIVDTISWLAGRQQALAEGQTDAEAIRFADAVVRQTQGTFAAEDISRLESGSPLVRALLQFYSYFNGQSNLLGTEFALAARDKDASRAAWVYVTGMMLPAIVAEAIKKTLGGDWDDEEEDAWLKNWLDVFFGSQLRYTAAMFPVAGAAVVSMTDRFNKGQPRDDRFGVSPAASTLSAAIGAPVGAYKLATTGKGEGKTVRDVLTLLSLSLPGFAGAVAGLAKRPAGYLADVREGKVEPTGPVDFTRGLITGRASAASKQ